MGNPEICFALLIGAVTRFFLHWNCWREFTKFLTRIMGLFQYDHEKFHGFPWTSACFSGLCLGKDLVASPPRSGPPKKLLVPATFRGPLTAENGGSSSGPKIEGWINTTYSRWWRFSNIFYVQPYLGKMNPIGRAYFSNGLVQPPTSIVMFQKSQGQPTFWMAQKKASYI